MFAIIKYVLFVYLPFAAATPRCHLRPKSLWGVLSCALRFGS